MENLTHGTVPKQTNLYISSSVWSCRKLLTVRKSTAYANNILSTIRTRSSIELWMACKIEFALGGNSVLTDRHSALIERNTAYAGKTKCSFRFETHKKLGNERKLQIGGYAILKS